MSTPMADTPKKRRARRRFDDGFKAQAVRLVLDEGQSVGAVARDLDLTETGPTGVGASRACESHPRSYRTDDGRA
jgi:Transposase